MRNLLSTIAVGGIALLGQALGAQDAPRTPEELARRVLSAIRADDENAIRELVMPDNAAAVDEIEPGAVRRSLSSMLRRTLPDGTTIRIQPPEEIRGYDPATATLPLGRSRLEFPRAPHRVITLSHQEKTATGIRGQSVMFAAAEQDGRWWIVLSAVRPAVR